MIKLDESKLAKLKTADQLLDEEYGKEGTLSRAEFHEKRWHGITGKYSATAARN